ncbi:MAG: hypothetical protein JWL70_2285, partial [Acidimicrobiia bacterium]|nr:hypothetical protein [Acidimicrobiia bacterium]
GAPPAALDSIEPLIADAHLHGEGLSVVATALGPLLVDHTGTPPAADWARVGLLPSVVPLLKDRQSFVPHVVVITDRAGADITAYGRQQQLNSEAGGQDRYPIERNQPGGWRQNHFQRRAENNWERNAEDVAAHVLQLVEQVQAQVVVVAGDVRAVELLQKSLPPALAGITHLIDGSRAAGNDPEEMQADIRRLVHTAAASSTKAAIDKFREEVGQHDRAADGPQATLEALAQAQVDVLLVHDDGDDERTAWFGPGPTQVGTRDQLLAMGVAEPWEARLVDVAVRAAMGTGAGVHVIPTHGGPSGSVGALLRWAVAQ